MGRHGVLLLLVAFGLTHVQAQVVIRLEQASNGTPEAPISAVEWVNATITPERGHYVESSSLPYRLVFETLLPGAHRVVIGWHTKNSGRHATDYLTYYQRLQPHNQFGAHNTPETIQPLRNVSGGLQGPSTFPIPPPNLPQSSFANLHPSQRAFHSYNATITNATYLAEESLGNDSAESRLAIDFVANQSPVVILFGGHLAAKTEWGPGQTAAGVAGADYRMRLVEFDGLPSLLNLSANATAVVAPPTCGITGPDPVCPGTTNVYTATTDAIGASFSWALAENSSGASIVGTNNGPAVQIRAGSGGRYSLQVSITQGSLHSTCTDSITVLTNVTTTPLTNTAVCPGGTATFSTQPAGTGPFTFVWRKGTRILERETNNTLVLSNLTTVDSGVYCVEVTGACNTRTNCAMLTVHASTSATPLTDLVRCVGESASFATTPSGTGPFTYRWRKNGVEIPEQTNRIYAIPSVLTSDAGTYSVEVSGLCNSITNSATLTVHALPPCGIQGPSAICPNSGGNTFAGPPGMAAYGWRISGNGVIVGPANEQIVVVSSSGAGFLTLTLSVTNLNGCSRVCSRTINVGDIQPPIIFCPANIETNTAPGSCSRSVEFTVTASDDCDGATVICNPPSGASFSPGTTTVNCTATDGAGNQAGCSFNVKVADLEKPVLSWPTNLVVNATPGMCETLVSYEVSVSDNCPGTSLICSPPSGALFPVGASSVTCRGSDAAGNVEYCTFDVTVIDNEEPQITCPEDLMFVTDPGQCDVLVNYDLQAIDNCALAQIVCLPPGGSLFPSGSTTVICVATDTSQNQSHCSFQVHVADTENPKIACPADIIVPSEPNRCDAVVNFIPKPGDNCGDVTVACVPPAGSRFAVGQTPVTCTATDSSDNTASCTFKVTVTDTQRPVLACPSNVTTNTEPGRCDAVVQYTATVTDNCAGLTVQCAPPSGSRFKAGVTVVNCTAADAGGNVVSCAFNVLVQDRELPEVSCPGDIIAEADPGECLTTVTYNVSVTDNCPGAEVFCTPESGSAFGVGDTPVYCVAVDGFGNARECSFVVIVHENEAPLISCPADIIIQTATGGCEAVATFTVTATDNCYALPVACVPPSGSAFPKGTNVVHCTAADPSGNTASCTFKVIVTDTEPPALTCPASTVVSAQPEQCDAVVEFAVAASDNCGSATVVCTPPSGSRFALGLTIVECIATDSSGNTNRCSFFVSVSDDEAPLITCPADIVSVTEPGRCDASVSFNAMASDNCAVTAITCAPPSGSRFSKGTTIVICTARDSSSNEESCAFNVTVNDIEPPAITCAPLILTGADPGRCDAAVSFAPSVADNCPGATIACSPPSGSRFLVGQTPVTCVATDASGNTNRCSFTVFVQDLEPPELICPENIPATTEPGQCDATVLFSPLAGDNCLGATVECVPPSGSRFPQGQTMVTCTATDASGNTAECSFTVTVNDNQPPDLSCPLNVLTNTAAGRCVAAVAYMLQVTDNCPGVELLCEPPSGADFPLGTNVVVCVGTDSTGNRQVCAFEVVVLDAERPIINCPPNVTVNTEPDRCDTAVTFTATAADNCSQPAIVCLPPSGSRFSKGATQVTCTATDASGNTATCSFTVTVNDTEPPVVTCPPDLELNPDPGMCSARGTFSVQVSDNCPGAVFACDPPSGSDFPVGTSAVFCEATDAAGNTASCMFNVYVIDTEPPRVTCPSNLTVNTDSNQCVARVSFTVSAEDACGVSNLVCTPPSGSIFAKGTTPVNCTARDASGNEATCAFNVIVRDNQAPVLVCPTNIVAAADPGRCNALVLFTASVSDNCPAPGYACTPPSGSIFALGTTPVTCVATDEAGNTNQCGFTVRVIDTQMPVVTCSSNLVVSADSNRCDAIVSFATSVTDNCGAMALSCTPPSGSRFNLGATTVQCSSTDGAGNVGTCSFTVTVRDTQPPTLQCPGNLLVTAAAGRCDATVNFNVSATDNCGSVSGSCMPPSGSTFQVGTTTVNCTAWDSSLNSTQCQFSVTVRDTELPTIQCPADIYVNTSTGRCDAIVTFAAQSADNCAGVMLTCTPPSGATFPKGTNLVTCIARDTSSNSVNCTFKVVVRDLEKPQIACPGNIVVSTATNDCRARVSYVATATDNCPGLTVTCNPPSNSYFNKGTNIVTCLATDAAGNTNACAFSVTVTDTVPPTLICPPNIVTNARPGQTSTAVQFAPTISDNCSGASYVCTPPSGSVFQQGTTTVTCTAADASGNTRSCSFLVTVNDDEPPAINCPTNQVVVASSGRCDAVFDYSVTATDNSQMVTVTCVPPSGSVFSKGLTSVLCSASDPASNTVSCGFTVTVIDLEKPVIACPTNMIVSTDRGRCDARVTYTTNVTDNCGGASLTCNPPSGAILPKGTNLVTCTASDTSGNTETCAFTVQVVDNERPLVGCPANLFFVTPPGECAIPVSFNASVADNCPGAYVSCSPASGSLFTVGTTIVTCTARDTSSNTSSCSFLVEVRDYENPTLNCPSEMIVPTYPNSCSAPVSYPFTVQDNCPGVNVTCTPPSGSTMSVGTNWVTCNAADTSGNTASCAFRVIVRDGERPTLTCPADIVLDGSNGDCSRVATYSPTVRDNCPGAIVTCIPPSGTTFPEGTNRVDCTAVDASGNVASCAFSVIARLQPLTAPPMQNQVRCAGESSTFTLSLNASSAAFTWLKNGIVLPGRTNASLVLSNLTSTDAGTYTVVATNACSGLTNSATLQVNAPVVITGLTNVTRCDCDPLVLSPIVSGTGPLSYVWRKNGSVLPGVTGDTLAFVKLSASDAGTYSVEVSGACNTAMASAALTVITVPNPAMYTNSGTIRINDLAAAFPYPSSIRVECVPQPVQRATVTLRGFTHAFPDDVDVLLAAPDGESVMLMSDAGDGNFANNVNITFDDTAALPLPDQGQLYVGTFRPGNYDTDPDTFPPPAPKITPASTLSAFAGTSPNGFWSLYVVDDFQLDAGAINNGWVLRLYWESAVVRLTAPRVLANGSFQMTVIGDPGATHTIEASSDLRTWTPIATVTLSGPETDFTDPNPASVRFYRCTQP